MKHSRKIALYRNVRKIKPFSERFLSKVPVIKSYPGPNIIGLILFLENLFNGVLDWTVSPSTLLTSCMTFAEGVIWLGVNTLKFR